MRRLLVVLALAVFLAPAAASDQELQRLRDDYARHFFDATAHLRLAKYLADHGQRLTAFYISEAARRGHFPEEQFSKAVRVAYLDDHFDNSPEAEQKLRDEIGTAEDPKMLLRLADIHLSREEYAQAEEILRKAAALTPDDPEAVSVLAEVLRRADKEVEGDRLEREWLKKHPQSIEAIRTEAQKLEARKGRKSIEAIGELVARFPQDAMLQFYYAMALQHLPTQERARDAFERAAALDPRSSVIQGWTGRFFLKVLQDPDRALDYYFAAYFLDPDFYDTEYAEHRITTITEERAAGEFERRLASGAKVHELLRDPDPAIRMIAVQLVESPWTADAAQPLKALLDDDNLNVRYPAADVLGRHSDAISDDDLRSLLGSANAYVRSAAAYAAGARFGQAIVPLMEPWLDAESDLMRYDGASVLAMYGGDAGKARLTELRASGRIRDRRIEVLLDALDKEAKESNDPQP